MKLRLKSILVSTDMSEAATPIYSWAAAIARCFDSQVTLFNVDETSGFAWPTRSIGTTRLNEVLSELSRRRAKRLAEARCWFEDRGITTEVLSATGRASDKVLKKCNEADLLIIGRRGAHRDNPAKLGSTTGRILRRAQVPILVVPRPPEELPLFEPLEKGRIIAATIFSTACLMSIDATLELAAAFEARVDAVNVIRLPVPFTIAPTDWPAIVGDATSSALQHLRTKDLTEYMGKERASHCMTHTVLGTSVGVTLRDLGLQGKVDLITLPSHSSSKEHPPWFGSTTENVVKRSAIPVLVFPVRFLEKLFSLNRD